MPDNKVEGWLYVGCDRLKDGEICWRDDGMASIGKDEIEGAWGSNVAGCPDNVEGRSGVDEDSWAWKNGEAVQPEAEKTGGDVRECWPIGIVSKVEGRWFTTELEVGDVDVDDTNVDDADVDDAEVNGADVDAEVNGADVDDAEVNGADVDDAEVNGADVDDAEVNDADVDDAEVNGTDVNGTDVDDAEVNGADVDDVEVMVLM